MEHKEITEYTRPDGLKFKRYQLAVSPMAEDTVLDRINRLPGKIIICYPTPRVDDTLITYWKVVR